MHQRIHMTYVSENLARLDQIDKRLGQQVVHLFWTKEMDGRLQRAFMLYFPTCTHDAHANGFRLGACAHYLWHAMMQATTHAVCIIIRRIILKPTTIILIRQASTTPYIIYY
jgi:hypothetical protein